MHMFQFVVLSCFTVLYVLIVLILVARLYRNLIESRIGGLDNPLEGEDLQHHISIEKTIEGTHKSTTETGGTRRPTSTDFRRVRIDTAGGPQST